MNRVELTGRLVRNPDVSYSHRAGQDSDLCIASYTLAVDREYANDEQQDADFIRCKAFGKKGEFVEKYFCKGMKVGVCGRIQTGSYENSEGTRIYTTDVVVEQQEFLESKATNDSIRSGANAGENGSSNSSKPQTEVGSDGFMNIPDDIDEELPFV